MFIRNKRLEAAFPYIEEAIRIRPEHLDLQTMMVYALANKYRSLNLTEDNLADLYQYGDKYPVLKENITFIDMICDAYMIFSVQNYDSGNLTKALNYHKKFSELVADNRNYSNYEYNISRLYSSAAVYYFRNGNTRKSKSIILEGLKLVPNSYELKQRLKAFY